MGMPHIRPLESKLREMRMTGRDGIARAVYAAVQGRTLLVLHVFVKRRGPHHEARLKPH